jgi:hypothetical protein
MHFFQAALDPGVHSESNRNEYQKQKNNVSGVERGRWVGLTTTIEPSVGLLSRDCGILNISQPYRPPRPVTGIALLSYKKNFTNAVSLIGWSVNNRNRLLPES